MAFSTENIETRFYIVAKAKCECCQKELVWKNRDKEQNGAWHAHHVSPVNKGSNDLLSNMAILCIDEPENCHLNQGHGSNYRESQPKTKWEFKKTI